MVRALQRTARTDHVTTSADTCAVTPRWETRPVRLLPSGLGARPRWPQQHRSTRTGDAGKEKLPASFCPSLSCSNKLHRLRLRELKRRFAQNCTHKDVGAGFCQAFNVKTKPGNLKIKAFAELNYTVFETVGSTMHTNLTIYLIQSPGAVLLLRSLRAEISLWGASRPPCHSRQGQMLWVLSKFHLKAGGSPRGTFRAGSAETIAGLMLPSPHPPPKNGDLCKNKGDGMPR